MPSDTKIADNKFAAPFEDMAERIRRNLEKEFGGALLVVPPQGDPIAVMLADPKQDLEAFLALCMGKLQTALQERQLASQQQFGNRR